MDHITYENLTSQANHTRIDNNTLTEFLRQVDLAKSVMYIVIGILAVLGNSLVLIATWRDKTLHQPNKYFVAFLAVSDLLVGILVTPLVAYRLNAKFKWGQGDSVHVCRILVWIDIFSVETSILTLTFISFDRYLKISKPLHYKSKMTTSKLVKIICSIWLIVAAFATYSVITNSCPPSLNKKTIVYYTFLTVIAFFVPVTVILIMYTLIYFVVRKRRKMLQSGELGDVNNNRNQMAAFLKDLKVIRMILVVVGIFILYLGPWVIWTLLLCHHPYFIDKCSWSVRERKRYVIANAVIGVLFYFNSPCNPVIYAYMDQTYRDAFRNLFRRRECRTRKRQQPEPANEPYEL